MKKVLIAVCFMLGFAGLVSAQEAKKKPAKTVKMEKAKAAAEVPAATAVAPKKTDGTLDKRYKVNKNKPAAVGPVKKDGTPDNRYRANKKKPE